MARIWNGDTPSRISQAMRWVRTRVLPDPAPATINKGPSRWVTASRWTGFSPASRSSSNPSSMLVNAIARFTLATGKCRSHHTETGSEPGGGKASAASADQERMAGARYRLVTRSDFDGLVCAVLLRELDMVDDILFVHPKDVQDGKVDITALDITTNLPYDERANLVFDHHHSETVRNQSRRANHIIDPAAPSAARVVYDYFGGPARFPNIADELMAAVDQADSAQYSLKEVLHPDGWTLLNFLMDARTGLGRFRQFGISNYQLMMQLIDYCRSHSVEEILRLPDVRERVDVYFGQAEAFKAQLERCSTVHGEVVVLDLRDEEVIHAGNRFMIYALYPECTVSVHVMWGRNRQNTVLAVGKSIVNRSSSVNIGELMLGYGGGGHAAAGTCQVPHMKGDAVLDEIVDAVNAPAVAARR